MDDFSRPVKRPRLSRDQSPVKALDTRTRPGPVLEPHLNQDASRNTNHDMGNGLVTFVPKGDQLRRLPPELRLIVYEELLVSPRPIVRGFRSFIIRHQRIVIRNGYAKLEDIDNEAELEEYASLVDCDGLISWQILLTCRLYHDEAAPIMYGRNSLVFCTTAHDWESGWFEHWPISARYLPFITNLGIYYRIPLEYPESRKVAYFVKAVETKAKKLNTLTILMNTEEFHWNAWSWSNRMLWTDPVCEAVTQLVKNNTIPHLRFQFRHAATVVPMIPVTWYESWLEAGGQSLYFDSNISIYWFRDLHETETLEFTREAVGDAKEGEDKIWGIFGSPSDISEGSNADSDLGTEHEGPSLTDEEDDGDLYGDVPEGFPDFVMTDHDDISLAFESRYLPPERLIKYPGELAPLDRYMEQYQVTDFFPRVCYHLYLDDVFGSSHHNTTTASNKKDGNEFRETGKRCWWNQSYLNRYFTVLTYEEYLDNLFGVERLRTTSSSKKRDYTMGNLGKWNQRYLKDYFSVVEYEKHMDDVFGAKSRHLAPSSGGVH